MRYVVLHLEKGAGNDAPISSHIERTIDPANADKSRTHLNRELIEFPEGVKNRTEAIQHRIENAGITRKISHNQVRAIRIMLTGTHEDIEQIKDTGKLNDWCADNLDWLKKHSALKILFLQYCIWTKRRHTSISDSVLKNN